MFDFEVGRFLKIEHNIVKVDPAFTGLDGLFNFFKHESEEIYHI